MYIFILRLGISQLDERLTVDKVLHGGFAASLMVHTALEHVKTTLERNKPQHVTSLSVQYLKPVAKGEIEIKVEHTRVSKFNATLHVALCQKGAPSVVGYVK
jgi:acyl-coenzyme A thioesterase PaaI-like protein